MHKEALGRHCMLPSTLEGKLELGQEKHRTEAQERHYVLSGMLNGKS